MASKEVRVGNIPDDLLEHFRRYLTTLHNETGDLSKPHLRRSIVNVYPLIIVLYAVIVLIGTASNMAVIAVIVRRRLYRDPTYFFVINLALSDIVKCVVVLPATLAVLLVQNWIFGSFMCHFISMMQDIPIHASMLTHVTIAIDRYRLIAYSSSIVSSRLPRCLCAFSVWMLAGCVALPYVFYVRYFDLGTIVGPEVAGTFLCMVNMEDDIEEYMRAMFICLYVLPLTIIAFLYVRIDGEFKVRDSPLATTTVFFEMSSTDERSTATSESTPCPGRSSWAAEACTVPVPPPPASLPVTSAADDDQGTYRPSRGRRCRRQTDHYEDDLDVRKERRTQKYLISMVTLFAMSLCPLKILGLGKHVTVDVDTSGNKSHFDIAFITFVWIGFLSTCTTPVLFASWRMSRSTKDRLLAYFRFNSRDRHSTTTAFVTAVDSKRTENGRGRNNDGYTHTHSSSSTGTSNRLTVVTGNVRRKSDERTAAQDDRRSTGPSRSKSLI